MTMPTALGKNPYVGPRAFSQKEQKFFYGRDEETAILAGLVMTRRAALFFAQSGAGKSSLINAGLIPELTGLRAADEAQEFSENQKMRVLPIVRVGGAVHPDLNVPCANIYVFNALSSLDPHAEADELAGLTLSEGLAPYFEGPDASDDLDLLLDAPEINALLIIDQFEELFTHHREHWERREDFFRQICQVLVDYPSLHVLFSMREDFIARLTPYAHLLPDGLRSRYRMERLKQDAALKAVKEPAARAGRAFSEGVAEALVDNLRRIQTGRKSEGQAEAGSGNGVFLGIFVEPVHLQIVCQMLWDGLRTDQKIIQAEHVKLFGNVDQALIKFYNDTLKAVTSDSAIPIVERTLRTWFDENLITPARTRGLVYRGEKDVGGLPQAAVDILVGAYIIRPTKRGDDTWYELAHDRLVEPILASNRAWQSTQDNPLAEATRAWKDAGRDQAMLLAGDDLAEARAFFQKNPTDVSAEERTFLEESKNADALKQARKNARRWLILTIIGTVLGGVLLFLTFQATKQRATAVQQRETAQAASNEAVQQRETAQAASTAAVQQREMAVQQRETAQVASTAAVQQRETAQAASTAAVQQRETAQVASAEKAQEKVIADAYKLAALALANRDQNLDRSLLLSVEAFQTKNLIQSRQALFTVWSYNSKVIQYLSGHQKPVMSLAWSPDGRWLAILSSDDTITILDPENGETRNTIPGAGGVTSLVWSPDGKRLASGSRDGTIIIWDPVSGESLHRLTDAGEGTSLAWSPDGERLAFGSLDGTIIIWDPESAETPNTLPGAGGVTYLAWSPDGERLASGSSEGTITIWDPESAETPNTLPGASGVTYLAWSPDGERLAFGSSDGTLTVWDPESGETPNSLPGAGGVTYLAWSPDGKWLAILTRDGTLTIWDPESGESLHGLTAAGEVTSLAWSPHGERLAFGSSDGTITVWDPESGETPNTLPGAGGVTNLAWSPDGKRLASGSRDGTIIIWNPVSGQALDGLPDAGEVTSLAWSAHGERLAFGSSDGTLTVWDPESGETPNTLPGAGDVTSLAWSPDSERLVSGSRDGTIIIWNPVSGESLHGLTYAGEVTGLAWSPHGERLAFGFSDGTLTVWDPESGETPKTLPGASGVTNLAWSSDGKWLANITRDGTITIWDPESGETLHDLTDAGEVTSLAWSPDGKWLAILSSDDMITLLDPENGETPDPIRGAGGVTSLAWSPDGEQLASGSRDGTITIWDPDGGQYLGSLSEAGEVRSLAWSPDGKWLAITTWDGKINIWGIKDVTKEIFIEIEGSHNFAWSADSISYLLIMDDFTVQHLVLDPEKWKEQACQRAGRNFTYPEWGQYFPREDYRRTCEQWPEAK